MVKQYPHYLFVLEAGEGQQDAQGNYTEVSVSRQFVGRCREEGAGKGAFVLSGGGQHLTYSSLVQLPKGTPPIEAGTRILVAHDSEGQSTRVEGVVVKFRQDQLHSRLWL